MADEERSPTQVALDKFIVTMREVVDKYPVFSPYKPDVRLAVLHDSPAQRLTCEVKMMFGSDPNNWTRAYFVKGLDDSTVDVLRYDLKHALDRDIGLLSAMARREKVAESKG